MAVSRYAVRTLNHQDVLCVCPPLALFEFPVPTVCLTWCPCWVKVGWTYAPRWLKRVKKRSSMPTHV